MTKADNAYLIKDILATKGDWGEDYCLLPIVPSSPSANKYGLPSHVLGDGEGAEVQAEEGQHQVQAGAENYQQIAVGR